MASSARATSYYFDVNGTAPGSGVVDGGSYTWTSGNNWATDNTGTSATTPGSWGGGTSNSATFVSTGDAGTDTFTITLVGGQSQTWVGNLTLNSGNLNIADTGGGANFVLGANSTWTVVAGSTLTDNNSGQFGFNLNGGFTLTLAGAGNFAFPDTLSNSGGLTMSGTGTAVLSGSNSYSSATHITSGAIDLENSAAAAGSGTTVGSGGALQLQGGISTTRAIALNLSGTGLTASPNGALENISGSNTYSGLLSLGANATVGVDAGTLTLSNTGTITGSGFGLTLAGAGNGTLASIIGTGAGGLTKTGAGTWTLTANNTYTGATNVNGGTLVLNNANTNNIATSQAINIASGATLDVTALSGSTIALGTQTLAGSGTVNGSVSTAAGTVIAPGGSTAIGNLTISNSLTLNGGSLSFSQSGASISEIIVGASGGFSVNASTQVNSYLLGTHITAAIPGTFNLVSYSGAIGGSPGFLAGPSGTGAIYAINSASNPLQLIVANALVWTGSTNSAWNTTGDQNWYDGNTNAASFSTGEATTFLDSINGVTVTNNNITIGAAGVSPGSVAVVNNTTNYTINSTDSTGITGSGSLSKGGTAKLTLTGTNTYTGGTNLNGGILNFANNSLGTTGAISVTGGTLQYAAGNTQDLSARILNSTSPVTIDTNGNAVSFATALASSNTGGLTLNDTNATPGSLSLTGASYSGPTAVTAGTLTFKTTAVPSSSIFINAGATLNYAGGGTQIGTTITGTGTLQVSGGNLTIGNSGNVNINLSQGALINLTGGEITSSSSYQGI
ncbi:MAG TPA: autotransporter-associated beta strand repeat-containing protein, partial [Tepidisphaeraceae bacterium]|nr:autotransporter-associated beta strand repeat-containing protein [Tepidisphaeraceae bacterium]